MIKGINSSGRNLVVSGGSPSSTYISPGAAGAGMIRWNPNMNCMEVNDGNTWKMIEMSYATVELTPEVESLLDWARNKRREEQELEALAKDHPAIKLAMDTVARAQEQLKLIRDLSIEHEPS
jgi:hypothetical protein